MLIVSNIKDEGFINLDYICHMCVKKLVAADGEETYSLFYSGAKALPQPGFIGEWKTRDAADYALDQIIKGQHLGLREVLLDD